MEVDGGGGIAPHTQIWHELEVIASCLGQCILEIQNPSTQYAAWVGSRADTGIFEEEKIINGMRQNVVYCL
jgi:hypothetical protein